MSIVGRNSAKKGNNDRRIQEIAGTQCGELIPAAQ